MTAPVLVRGRDATGVAARWKEAHCRIVRVCAHEEREEWSTTLPRSGAKSAPQIYQELLALGDSPSVEDVDAIIGDDSWTTGERCDACNAQGRDVVRVGDWYDDDTDSPMAHLCETCVRAALALFEGPK